ncbi:MAG: HD domain-containing protein [Myxococcota bacterium]|nr:HD domain-containing protein [Myxococcota bacterium]
MPTEVRDPIHGAIGVTAQELPVLDHPFVQRLRNILQMGFSQLPFPGAVHSRYIHAVGVMHLAGRAFDSAFGDHSFTTKKKRDDFRQVVRLAGLLHDVGHAPFSHCSEFAMPNLGSLAIDVYDSETRALRDGKRASHEDYTIGILTKTELERTINEGFDFTARHVAALISREVFVDDDFFEDGGLDYRRVLSQLISSELDVDRLDYLVRDSYFSGARYGQVDVNWLINNLTLYREGNEMSLAMNRRAIYAFDDFMVARYHMFVMVYFHHKSVAFEEMLKRYITGPNCTYSLPSSMEEYLWVDDVQMHAHLRGEQDQWAQGIVRGQPWSRVLELHGTPAQVDPDWASAALDDAGIENFTAGSTGKLSRYTVFGQKREGAPSIFVVDDAIEGRLEVSPLEDATAIFERYQDERRISRVYVAPENKERAKAVLSRSRRG